MAVLGGGVKVERVCGGKECECCKKGSEGRRFSYKSGDKGDFSKEINGGRSCYIDGRENKSSESDLGGGGE